MFKRFEELKATLESKGYTYRFNENSGTHEFIHKDNEEDIITAYDHLNEAGDATDWNKVCDELELNI